jgi:hypothetical protein
MEETYSNSGACPSYLDGECLAKDGARCTGVGNFASCEPYVAESRRPVPNPVIRISERKCVEALV